MTIVRGLGNIRHRGRAREKFTANPMKLNVINDVARNNNIRKQKRYDNEKEMRHKKRSRGTAGGNISSSNTASGFHVDNGILCEILSRLPVKSLVRFKCVCKRWRFLIQEDSYFIDLHLNHSKEHPILFYICLGLVDKYAIFIPEINNTRLMTVMPEGRAREVSTTFVRPIIKMKLPLMKDATFFGPVNGLIGYECYESDYSKQISGIRICNISTQDVTPWIKSPMPGTKLRKTYYQMGFDPLTKKHKVICICPIHLPGYSDECEVLTVGTKKWRRIENTPFKLALEYYERRQTLYLNGYIYFCTSNFLRGCEHGDDKIVAFDVGAEKFRVITVPYVIRNEPRYYYPGSGSPNHLLELEGRRLALLSRTSDRTAKLWAFDDDIHGNNKEKNIRKSSSSNKNWTEVTMDLPYSWIPHLDFSFQSVPETHQIIIESHHPSNFFELHCYNWKTKSCKKIDISGFNYYPLHRVAILVESLLPVW